MLGLTLKTSLVWKGSQRSFSMFPPTRKIMVTTPISTQEKMKLNPTPLWNTGTDSHPEFGTLTSSSKIEEDVFCQKLFIPLFFTVNPAYSTIKLFKIRKERSCAAQPFNFQITLMLLLFVPASSLLAVIFCSMFNFRVMVVIFKI